MSTEKRPKVSVAMITYNHERYVEQAVRSVMMQQTDFEYELIIGEDCSTDRTREIVVRLKEEFGDRIQLLLHERNQGMVDNFFAVYAECRGEYVALIEGDDFWINPRKLQLQVEYLDSHPECVISYHNAFLYDSTDKTIKIYGWDIRVFDLRGFIEQLVLHDGFINIIPTASVMFRRPSEPLLEAYRHLKLSLDWGLYAWLLSSGGQAHLLTEEAYSVYRIHPGGITQPAFARNKRNQEALRKVFVLGKNFIADLQLVSSILPESYKSFFDKVVYDSYADLGRLAFMVDRTSFNEVHEILKDLSPGKRYIPASPFHLRLASLLFGYPRAEWLALKYRLLRAKLDPVYRNSATIPYKSTN